MLFLEAVSNPQYSMDLGPVIAAIIALAGVAGLFFLFIKYANKAGQEAITEARRIANTNKEQTLQAVGEKIGTCQTLHNERDKNRDDTLVDLKEFNRRLDERFDTQSTAITKLSVEVNTLTEQLRTVFKRLNGETNGR